MVGLQGPQLDRGSQTSRKAPICYSEWSWDLGSSKKKRSPECFTVWHPRDDEVPTLMNNCENKIKKNRKKRKEKGREKRDRRDEKERGKDEVEKIKAMLIIINPRLPMA